MTLSNELARPLPRMPFPQIGKRCLLQIEADKAVQRFGGMPAELRPGQDHLARAEEALRKGVPGLEELSPRDLRAAPYLIWARDSIWRQRKDLVRAFLELADREWHGAVRRLWRQYVVTFETGDWATEELGRWLFDHREQLPRTLRSFSERHRLLEPLATPQRLASEALTERSLVHELEDVGIGLKLFRSTGLLVSILGAVGELLLAPSRNAVPLDRLTDLLGGQSKNAIAESNCSDTAKREALRSLVTGIVKRQRHADPRDEAPERVLDFLLSLNGDPRFAPHRWRDRVPDDVVRVIEQWLSRKTIDAFFRVIDTLKTDRQDMWESRRRFWLAYLPWVSRAWLVVGSSALTQAKKEGLRFGRFRQDSSTQPDHCGLMLEIRGLTVLEMNKNGRAVFWTAKAKEMPSMYDETYSRNQFLVHLHRAGVKGLSHLSGWEKKFRDFIVQETGVAP
jgi:hypothetical protein